MHCNLLIFKGIRFTFRHGVLSVEGAATDPDEDFSGEERMEQEVHSHPHFAKCPLWPEFMILFQKIKPSTSTCIVLGGSFLTWS